MTASFPKLLFRYIFLIFATVVILYCIQDSVFEILVAMTPKEPDDPTILPLNGDHGNGTTRELVFLQMLFRHGHRAPFMTYPTDATNESFWKEGMGMLTKLGRYQHYAFGQYFQNRYMGFITTNPKEVDVVMSEASRCQVGAYCFMAGFYKPIVEHQFTQELSWQPIVSRHAEGLGPDAKHVLSRRGCPAADKESHRLKSSQIARDTLDKFKDIYEFWSKGALRLINSWTLAADLGKTLAVERDYNLSVPDWGLKYWNDFNFQAGISYYFNYGTAFIQRLRIGPVIGYMIKRMKYKAQKKYPEKKVLIYSSHGSNIACLLLALGQYNWLGPPHAATLVVELWKDQRHQYSVRWLFFNSSSPERRIEPPLVIRPTGCAGDFCPLSVLARATRHLVPRDLSHECKRTYDTNKTIVPSVIIPGLYSKASPLQVSFPIMLLIVVTFFFKCHERAETFLF